MKFSFSYKSLFLAKFGSTFLKLKFNCFCFGCEIQLTKKKIQLFFFLVDVSREYSTSPFGCCVGLLL